MNLSIFDAAAEHGSQPFLITSDRSLTFSQVAQRVAAAAHWLQSVGVRPAQTAPFVLEATLELRTVIVLLALFELGVPALLIHPRWTEIERARVLKQADVGVSPLPDNFALFGPAPELNLPSGLAATSTLAIVYTSGSAGTPRGVRLSRGAFLASAHSAFEVLGLEPHDRWLLCLPLAHIGGLSILTRCLIARKTVVLSTFTPSQEHFSAADALRLIEATQTSLVSLVPTQLGRLLDSSLRCPRSLRAVLLGGADAAPTLLRRAAHARWPILCTYGLTEACSLVTLERLGAEPAERSAGAALPGTEVRVVAGRIEIRSGSLLSGYFPDEPPNLDAEGWFATSDSGALDAQGQLHVLGRLDDTIISGGENVHPLEVEHVLLEHPGVAAACVFPIASERWGQEVAAAIVVRSTGDLSDLPVWLESRLAAFKRPQKVALVPQLPTTASGKVSRLRAQQLFESQCVPWSHLLH